MLHKEESIRATNQKKKTILVKTCSNFSNVTREHLTKCIFSFIVCKAFWKMGCLLQLFCIHPSIFLFFPLIPFKYPLDITKENQHRCLCLYAWSTRGQGLCQWRCLFKVLWSWFTPLQNSFKLCFYIIWGSNRVMHKVTLSSPCFWASFHPLSLLLVVYTK